MSAALQLVTIDPMDEVAPGTGGMTRRDKLRELALRRRDGGEISRSREDRTYSVWARGEGLICRGLESLDAVEAALDAGPLFAPMRLPAGDATAEVTASDRGRVSLALSKQKPRSPWISYAPEYVALTASEARQIASALRRAARMLDAADEIDPPEGR